MLFTTALHAWEEQTWQTPGTGIYHTPCSLSGFRLACRPWDMLELRSQAEGIRLQGAVLTTCQLGHFIHCTPVILISTSVESSVESNGQAGLRKMWKDYRPASSFSLLLLFFSILFRRFSSRRLASSASWCRRHLWKFSTTTPTNIFSTKKATIKRKEMKYSSIQGLWFIIGYNTQINKNKLTNK